MDPQDVVSQFFRAFYQRDWERIPTFFADDAVYWDVPLGPQQAARGGAGVVRRLRGSLGALASFEDRPHRQFVDGTTVATEHDEIWVWPSGESVTLPVVSLHVVREGLIVQWKDYWDFQTLLSGAPATWLDEVANGDMSWVYDASAEI
jgi:limonene-1,2-epoxide hydrolase